MLYLPPLRFHCAGGCWDRTQDCCKLRHFQSGALTTRLDLMTPLITHILVTSWDALHGLYERVHPTSGARQLPDILRRWTMKPFFPLLTYVLYNTQLAARNWQLRDLYMGKGRGAANYYLVLTVHPAPSSSRSGSNTRNPRTQHLSSLKVTVQRDNRCTGRKSILI